MNDDRSLPGPPYRASSRSWGAMIRSDADARPVAAYHAAHARIAYYAARVQYPRAYGLRTWEETAVALGLPLTTLAATSALAPTDLIFPFVFLACLVGAGLVHVARWLAARATTARLLPRGKAISRLVASANDELIDAAIGGVIAFDTDPVGAEQLVGEIDAAWSEAQRCMPGEQSMIISALRETAADFPTTSRQVEQVRSELGEVRRQLASLAAARRELEAATSTSALADPPEPAPSVGRLRAAATSLAEDVTVVREVAQEQRRSLQGDPG